MPRYDDVKIIAPKLLRLLDEHGIKSSAKDDVITFYTSFYVPSGLSACIYDEDAWGETLYGPQEMDLPRDLCFISSADKKGSIAVWLLKLLSGAFDKVRDEYDWDEDSEDEDWDDDDSDSTSSFCLEFADILHNIWPDQDIWKQVAKLDEDIISADILLYYHEDGDFDFEYTTVENGQKTVRTGGSYDPDCFEGGRFSHEDLKKLICSCYNGDTYRRFHSEWKKS